MSYSWIKMTRFYISPMKHIWILKEGSMYRNRCYTEFANLYFEFLTNFSWVLSYLNLLDWWHFSQFRLTWKDKKKHLKKLWHKLKLCLQFYIVGLAPYTHVGILCKQLVTHTAISHHKCLNIFFTEVRRSFRSPILK